MRCVHMVEKASRSSGRVRLKPCRHRLKSISRKLLLGGLRWHVYRCRFGHEKRYYVKP